MKRFLQFLLVSIVMVTMAFATVTVTPASGGTGLSGTKALNGISPAFTTLGDFTIVANSTTDFPNSNGARSMIFTTPANWKFQAGTGTFAGSAELTSQSIVVTDTTITISYKRTGTTGLPSITISGIKVQSADGSNTTAVTITRTGGTSSAVGAGVGTVFATLSNDGVLPVELVSFTNTIQGNKVLLNWATATEVNSALFEVEKKSGDVWTKVASVQAAGTSNTPKQYSYVDKSVVATSYRLKMVDSDGKFAYSSETYANVTPAFYGLVQNFPNPLNPTTTISFAVDRTEHATVKVYNILGEQVAEIFNEVVVPGHMYSVRFDATHLASGNYFYALKTDSRLETKRMTLVK